MHDFLETAKHLFTDLPGFLDGFIADYGFWVYALLFAIIFAETGLVVAPFLPGDSLLFTVGALAARGTMNVWLIAGLLIVAGVLGDAVNYWVGKWIGPRVFRYDPGSGKAPTLLERLLNRRHLDRAHEFYEKYGGKAVVLGRFVPIVRTFVPFVAGAGAMNYSKFVVYNIAGAVLWVGVCVGAGYAFGNIDFVKNNFELVVVGIIIVSVIPMGVEWVLARRRAKSGGKVGEAGPKVGEG
ncbi:MAG TPA: VTT domain-containing protein [Phycisphaerales bacterium]|nr:VTT domain-containing protein [Phycisphaerales bacterium]